MNDYERRLIKVTREACEKEFNSRASSVAGSNKNSPSPAPTALTASQISSLSPSLSFATLDVFTSTPFKGNQLAVIQVPNASHLSVETKKAIAREFNFSETIFVSPSTNGPGSQRQIGIFTVTGELPFAGHPVIGAACYICQHLEPGTENMTLNCPAGPITVRYGRIDGMAEVDVPHNVKIHKEFRDVGAVVEDELTSDNINITTLLPVVSIVKGMTFVLIQMSSIENLASGPVAVDTRSVVLDDEWSPSFIGCYFYTITSQQTATNTRLRTRMLEASVGEDAATGSAACTLACYLALKDSEAGQTYQYIIEQGVEMGRASEIHVIVTLGLDALVHSVILAGRAVLVTQGTLRLPK